MKIFVMFSFLAALFSGCSKQGGLSLSGAKVSGDIVPVVMQCVTNRGGHVTTNTFPVIQAGWVYQLRDIQDVFLVDGDHFTEVQKVFEQAFGAPDTSRGSLAVAPVGLGRALTYSPQQIGVTVNLTADSKQTFILVFSAPKL
jgi:hypothetical protein